MLTKITEGFYIDLDGIVALEEDGNVLGDEEFYVYVDTRDCPISLTSEKFKALRDVIDKCNQELSGLYQPGMATTPPSVFGRPIAPPIMGSPPLPEVKVSHWQNGRITGSDILLAATGKHSQEV